MNRTRRTNTLTAVAVFVAVACITGSGILVNEACATVGTSDPVVVKAEDVLTNSLSVYTAAMNYHFANSTKETPAVYKSFEEFQPSRL